MSPKVGAFPKTLERTMYMIEGLKKYQLNKSLPVPVYYQFASLVQYLADQLAPIGKDEWILLPTKSDLKIMFSFSNGTVEEAYKLLAMRGVIERYPGKGTKLTPGYTRSNRLIGPIIGPDTAVAKPAAK